MFTGIVEQKAKISGLEKLSDSMKIVLEFDQSFISDVKLGDSIAVNGICLTVSSIMKNLLSFYVSHKTCNQTTICVWEKGMFVNIEKAMQLNSRFGGHIVSGHIDGVGEIIDIENKGAEKNLKISTSSDIIQFLLPKGSVSIDGVSLTVGVIQDSFFTLLLVPFTTTHTIFEKLRKGDQVNIEADMLGKYVHKFLQAPTKNNSITLDYLQENGF